jgi:hypothetical protein
MLYLMKNEWVMRSSNTAPIALAIIAPSMAVVPSLINIAVNQQLHGLQYPFTAFSQSPFAYSLDIVR